MLWVSPSPGQPPPLDSMVGTPSPLPSIASCRKRVSALQDCTRHRLQGIHNAAISLTGRTVLVCSWQDMQQLKWKCAPPAAGLPELDGPGWVANDFVRDMPVDFTLLLENVMDPDHGIFAHQTPIFDSFAASPDHAMTVSSEIGRAGEKVCSLSSSRPASARHMSMGMLLCVACARMICRGLFAQQWRCHSARAPVWLLLAHARHPQQRAL